MTSMMLTTLFICDAKGDPGIVLMLSAVFIHIAVIYSYGVAVSEVKMIMSRPDFPQTPHITWIKYDLIT